jgi:hypothetical protein
MANFRALVTIPAVSGVAKDSVANNWSVTATSDPATWGPNFEAALKSFYDAWGANRSSLYVWTGARCKTYALADPTPRVPVRDVSLALSGSVATNTLPSEVALVLTFQGPIVSGTPQARRRGRVYLGPFSSASADSATGRPASALLSTMSTAAIALKVASVAATDWDWVVISNVNPAVPVSTIVTNGWVDNAWDTQRRRGIAFTARGAWS